MNEQAADESEIGLQLLFAGGLGEAMAAAQATLADVQRAVERMSGVAAVHSTGVPATAVPTTTSATTAMETPSDLSQPTAPASSAAPIVVTTSAPLAVDNPATPRIQVVGSSLSPPPPHVAPEPIEAPPPVPVAPEPAEAPLPAHTTSAPIDAQPPAAPMLLASFAPVLFGQPAPSGDGDDGDAWRAPAPAPTERYFATARDPAYAPTSRTDSVDRNDGIAPMSRAMAPPPAQSGAGGPTGGDVFLDGARVGTWIADNLAREAGRPQAGGTGFDPRLTASWPGTLQGG